MHIEPIGFVYMTINKVNNKKYIGQHKNFEDDYLGSGKVLQRAIKKYGKENFERIILDIAYSPQELNEKERYYIKCYNAVTSKMFYNIHVGGEGGDTFSGKLESEKEEFRNRMSEVTKGKNNGMYGKNHSVSTKEKIRLTRLANMKFYNFLSEEFRNKMSVVTSGKNNGMYGRQHSEESKNKMSKNSKGKNSGKKNGMYGMKDEKALNGKKIYQYADQSMTMLINEFNSIKCALQHLNLKGHIGLDKALDNSSIYKGFYWSRGKKGVETIENTIECE